MRQKEMGERFFSIGLLVLLLFGISQGVYRYLLIRFGNHELSWDAQNWWIPVSEAVFSGTPLYVGAAMDNKPPLFQFLNLAVASTGYYNFVFLFLIGLTTGFVALLLAMWIQRIRDKTAGLLAGLLFLSCVPAAGGFIINVRTFGVAALLVALLLQGPIKKGVAIAVGGLFTQFIIFAIPVVVYHNFCQNSNDFFKSWFLKFSSAGLSIVAISYAVVGLIWGVESLFAGIVQSFIIGPLYAVATESPLGMTTGGEQYAPLTNPLFYSSELIDVIIRIPHVLIPAYLLIRTQIIDEKNWSTKKLLIGLSFVLLLPLLVRGFRTNWIYSLPFLSGMAGIMISEAMEGSHV
jgi:hypothetical protein